MRCMVPLRRQFFFTAGMFLDARLRVIESGSSITGALMGELDARAELPLILAELKERKNRMRDKELCRVLENIYKILRSLRLSCPMSADHADLIDREMLDILETIEGMGGGVD